MSTFSLFVGVDYSGAETPTSRLKSLQVFAAQSRAEPVPIQTPAIAQTLAKDGLALRSVPRYWTRSEIALWLVNLIKDGKPALIGIDHGFSFPDSYFDLPQPL